MMAARKTKQRATPETTRKVGPRSGLVRVMFSVEPEQLEALQAEALRRAKALQAGRERGRARSVRGVDEAGVRSRCARNNRRSRSAVNISCRT